ncbi:K(+)-transporting ATPase subunit F, partial [Roseivivax isoporae]|uniref:K(+)-transporting ATPase subunit F n=1 Tax=Roseivivax isoporae TaxID=591206 RepID=UPI001FCC1774
LFRGAGHSATPKSKWRPYEVSVYLLLSEIRIGVTVIIFDLVLGSVVAAGLLIYLVAVLARPERF